MAPTKKQIAGWAKLSRAELRLYIRQYSRQLGRTVEVPKWLTNEELAIQLINLKIEVRSTEIAAAAAVQEPELEAEAEINDVLTITRLVGELREAQERCRVIRRILRKAGYRLSDNDR